MHMYKLRLRAIIAAFNKKRCIILTFKSTEALRRRRWWWYGGARVGESASEEGEYEYFAVSKHDSVWPK